MAEKKKGFVWGLPGFGAVGPQEPTMPKMRVCDKCGKPDFYNSDSISYHEKHGGKLVKMV